MPLSFKKRSHAPQDGFAILESLIAMLIFSVGILAVFSMQTTSIQANDLSRGITEQSAIASVQLEQLMALPYNHLDLSPGNYAAPGIGRYNISWTITQDVMIPNTKTITVTVSWLDQGKPKTTNLTYIKSEPA